MAYIDLNEIIRLREILITKYPLSFSGGISATILEMEM